ncbi:MAG TPA: L,D-transpeptidase family protein [Planctomycetota bacterium]|jgi:hypothetical protein
MRARRVFLFLAIAALLLIAWRYGQPMYLVACGRKLPASVLENVNKSAAARLSPYLQKAGFTALPSRLALLAFKTERRLELWGEKSGAWVPIRSYPILAASGKLGPKLREGDRQVPEGVYQISYLNAASDYYLSMKLDYPNAFDQQKASQDGRTNLGGDICVHGWEVSVGCIAVGNVAIEELFFMVSKVGAANTKVVIAPYDLRLAPPILSPNAKVTWLKELYANIERELRTYSRKAEPQINADERRATRPHASLLLLRVPASPRLRIALCPRLPVRSHVAECPALPNPQPPLGGFWAVACHHLQVVVSGSANSISRLQPGLRAFLALHSASTHAVPPSPRLHREESHAAA